MSVVTVTNGEAVFDLLLCFVFGLGMSLAYQITTALFPLRGRVGMLLWHIIFFAAAGLCAFCFCIGVTTCKEPRWQLVLGFFLGIAAYCYCFSRLVGALTALLMRLLRWLLAPVLWPVCRLWDMLRGGIVRLQNGAAAVYNRRRQQRAQRRGVEVERGTEQRGRPPVKAAHKT